MVAANFLSIHQWSPEVRCWNLRLGEVMNELYIELYYSEFIHNSRSILEFTKLSACFENFTS